MDSLRSRLRSASSQLPACAPSALPSPTSPPPSRLVQLSALWQLLLTSDGSLHVLRASHAPVRSAPCCAEVRLSRPLPRGAHTLVPARGSAARVAVVAPAGVSLVTVDVTAAVADVAAVAAPLFAARPALQVLQVAWHPRAEDYLMLLTSDGSLRLYDVAAGGHVEGERMRLRVVTTGDRPVAFAFGKVGAWDSVSVYVLTESGAIYVVSPVAPLGTRLSREDWEAMRGEAEAVIGEETPSKGSWGDGGATGSNVLVEETSRPILSSMAQVSISDRANGSAGKGSTVSGGGATSMMTGTTTSTRRQLKFSSLEDDDGEEKVQRVPVSSSRPPPVSVSHSRLPALSPNAQEGDGASWSVRQARLQLRFLERTFEQTDAGDMLMMREFKPAPVLFQGPLYIERDDVDDLSDGPSFTSLTVLDSGPDMPPVLLRCAANGHISVLVGMEAVEGQWFLSEGLFGTTGEKVIEATEGYAKAASVVAPSLLCLEHLEFPTAEAVALHPLRGKSDFDVLFARSGSTVYSVRLPFLAGLRNPESLHKSSPALIVPLLSTARLGANGKDNATASETAVVGLAPMFLKQLGPLAVALTGAHSLEATAPLRCMADDSMYDFPESLLSGGPDYSSATLDAKRPDADSDGIALRKAPHNGIGAEVAETLTAARSARDVQTWTLGAGSVGCVRDATSVTDALNCVEARVSAFTGADGCEPGVGDHLKSLGLLIPKWADEVAKRGRAINRGVDLVRDEFDSRHTEADALTVKLRRVVDINENLRARVNTLRELHESRQAALSHAEVARIAKLKERRRNVVATRRKIVEISTAVRALNVAAESASRKGLSTGGIPRGPDNSIGSLSGSPLVNRRTSFSSYGNGGGGGSGGRGGRGDGDLSATQLQRIKENLAQHSASITAATERSQALWEKFASA